MEHTGTNNVKSTYVRLTSRVFKRTEIRYQN